MKKLTSLKLLRRVFDNVFQKMLNAGEPRRAKSTTGTNLSWFNDKVHLKRKLAQNDIDLQLYK